MSRNPHNWMWADAVALLNRAERLHRDLFQPGNVAGAPVWEPPADIFETDRELWIILALPGVVPDQIRLRVDNGTLVVAGERRLPDACRKARVLRLEVPNGNFERRLPLPAGRYELGRREFANGCMLITLAKIL
jgi:HSP20 family molecular chaperone IbpA